MKIIELNIRTKHFCHTCYHCNSTLTEERKRFTDTDGTTAEYQLLLPAFVSSKRP